MSSAMMGRWGPVYEQFPPGAQPFGESAAYAIGAEWLADCFLVEDWGCGLGGFRLARPDRYRGIDGTASDFVDKIADLRRYRSEVPGIFCRGVLEHNHQWAKILANLVASFQERACLAIFTPMQNTTRVLDPDPAGIGVPDIGFSFDDLLGPIEESGAKTKVRSIDSATHYGGETIIMAER